MMKLLIVEDEPYLKKRLAGIDWEACGIEPAAVADTRQSALESLQRVTPDLVLLDIRLPDGSGLSLIPEIAGKTKWVKIVVLSGHDDFEYARQAIECGVDKYLLKPSTNEEIVSAVLEAKEKLQAELDEQMSLRRLKEQWNEHLPHLRERFLLKLAQGKLDDWQIERGVADLKLAWSRETMFVAMVADIDPISPQDARYREEDRELLQFSLLSIANELFPETVVFPTAEGRTCILMMAGAADGTEERLAAQARAGAEKLLGIVKSCIKSTASVGIGTAVRPFSRIRVTCAQAAEALAERSIWGIDVAIGYEPRAWPAASAEFASDAEGRLEVALDKGSEEELRTALELLADERMAGIQSVREFREQVYGIAGIVIRLVQKRGWSVESTLGEPGKRLERLGEFATRDELKFWLGKLGTRMAETLQAQRTDRCQAQLDRMLQFIEDTLDKEISLQKLSQALYLNPSYLSRLFKRELGVSFTDYVWRRKMEKAKEWLQSGDKVYLVAERLGYHNLSFFAKSFKKYWGVSPGDMKGS